MKQIVLLITLFISLSLAEPPSIPSDTTDIDTAEISRIREFLKEQLTLQKAHLYDHPTSIDSLYGVNHISAYRIERQDYSTWNDLLFHPLMTSVYYTPNSHLNRVLPFGFTFPQRESHLLNGIHGRTIPTIPFEPLWVKSLQISPSGNVLPEHQTRKLISPELFINSETGLFNSNSLEIRLLRNMTRHLAIGVFTSYRELKRTNYNHNNGSMYNMFKSWGLDEKDLSNTGYNPEAISHLSTIALQWQNRSSLHFSFTYGDLNNDQVYSYPLEPHDTVWFTESDYLTKLQAGFHDTLFTQAFLNLEAQYCTNKHLRSPLSKGKYSSLQKNRGTTDYSGLGSELLLQNKGPHNFAALVSLNRNKTDRYNRVSSTVYQGDLYLSDSLSIKDGQLYIKAGGGPSLIHSKGTKNRFVPRYEAATAIQIRKTRVSGFVKSEITPTFINYDTTTMVLPNGEDSTLIKPFIKPEFYGDTYFSSGISAYFSNKRLALFGSYTFLTGIDSTLAKEYWAQGYAPYLNPTHQLTVAPSLFFNNVVSLSSNWTVSDSRPHIKNNSRVTFHINRYKNTRHFYIDIFNRFWSERDPVTFGGKTGWNKPVNDIGLKLTAEIRSFRIFYKMENLINRNNSYVPGYEMPGFIIRWGFNWTITG